MPQHALYLRSGLPLGDDMHIQIGEQAEDVIADMTAAEPEPARPGRVTDHHLRHVLCPRIGSQRLRDVAAVRPHRFEVAALKRVAALT